MAFNKRQRMVMPSPPIPDPSAVARPSRAALIVGIGAFLVLMGTATPLQLLLAVIATAATVYLLRD